MKNALHLLIAVCVVAAFGCGADDKGESLPASGMSAGYYMEYEGQKFYTSKQYTDWDEFKEDPNNYLASETQKMQDAVRGVKFIASAADREVVMDQMFDKQFPGFGCGQLGILNTTQLDDCAAFSIEIPRTELDRYAGYVKIEGRFVLVADFVAPQQPMLFTISVEDGYLNFHGIDKSVMRRDPIPAKK